MAISPVAGSKVFTGRLRLRLISSRRRRRMVIMMIMRIAGKQERITGKQDES